MSDLRPATKREVRSKADLMHRRKPMGELHDRELQD
jgi:hypothetical protein